MIVYFHKNMKTVILFTLLGYASTATNYEPSPRSVNVALETSFLFEPKDIKENIKFVKNIKDFLDKLYTMLAPQIKNYNSAKNTTASKQFRAENHQEIDNRNSDFSILLKEFCDNIANASLITLEQSLSIIKKEIHQIIDTNQHKLKEIMPYKNIKKIVKESYDNILNSTSNVKYCYKNPTFKKFAKKMDRIYSQEDLKKLLKYLRKFNKAIDVHSKTDASRLVREFIQFGIVDKYNELNVPGREIFVKETGLLLDYIHDKNKERSHNKIPHKIINPLLPTKEIVFAIDDAKNLTSELDMDTRRFRADTEEKVGVERPKKEKKRSGKNEIIVDNIELVVQSLKL